MSKIRWGEGVEGDGSSRSYKFEPNSITAAPDGCWKGRQELSQWSGRGWRNQLGGRGYGTPMGDWEARGSRGEEEEVEGEVQTESVQGLDPGFVHFYYRK